MSTDEIKAADSAPCCKPFRISELIIIALCFSLLFFLRQYNAEDEIICTPSVLIFLFTAIGSTMFITFIDVVCQRMREPVPNAPMILSLLLGSIMCLTSAITALFVHSLNSKCKSQRNLNTLCLFAGFCFFSSLIYILDALIVIRYSC